MGQSNALYKSLLDNEKVLIGFTSRFGGVSKGEFSSLNLALHVGDNEKLVLQNRELLKKATLANEIIFMNQIHSDIVCEVDKNNEKKLDCDAIITKEKGVLLCVMVADCGGVLIYDEKNLQIATIHAGREGVIKKIFTKTILKMKNPSINDLKVFVIPGIKGSCYEVGDLDLKDFNRYKIGKNFMIEKALEDEILSNGIKKENIYMNKICTHCDENYFSYRRQKKCGRFVGFAMLK